MAGNLITDVAGVRVGHASNSVMLSGVTVALIEAPNMAGAVVRGGAPGTRGVSILAPETVNQHIDAVVLSGGSAFGLDAAGGVMAHLVTQGVGFTVGSVRVPIVAQAITFDLLAGGAFDPAAGPAYWHLGCEAARAATGGAFALGSVGGGLGATTATVKGGVGSASARTATGHWVGALAVVNAVGSATIGDGPHFWSAPYEVGAEYGGRGMSRAWTEADLALRMKGGAPPSTTIALVATDAVLDKSMIQRMAMMADDGLARAVRPVHAAMDGDTVFAVATQRAPLADPVRDLTAIGAVAADCLARAIARGIYEATDPGGSYRGPPAYRDRFGLRDGGLGDGGS